MSPFKSEKQRKKLWADRPDVARRWAKKYSSKPQPEAKRTTVKRRMEKNRGNPTNRK